MGNLLKIRSIAIFRPLMAGPLVCLALFMGACATFDKPAAINEAPVHDRALTKEENGIRVSAAVVGDSEAMQIFGVDLFRKNIQAVWLDVENHSGRPLILLPTAMDPDYFSPLEVAFAFHTFFAPDGNRALDEHLSQMNFPIRTPILPGVRSSGYIFTNWLKGMKVIDVDLLGRDFIQNFTFFADNPDSSGKIQVLERMEAMFSDAELQHVESDAELRRSLEQLACCVSQQDGALNGEPFNVVVIGEIEHWTTAFLRRGYRYHPVNPRYAFGRTHDFSGHKLSRGYKKAKPHVIRFWQTPIRYKGKTVWAAQTSSRLGGRFADKASLEVTLPMDPYVDEARDDLAQDLAYSQALTKIGYVKGSGPIQRWTPSGKVHYTTDGLRVVLVFGERPASLAGVDFFDWERLADYR